MRVLKLERRCRSAVVETLMARGGASIQPSSVQHIIPRFVAKEWFIESALERNVYLSLLSGALETTDWRCFSFALMSSHIHLGLLAGQDTLASWMRPMHTLFARWMNEQRGRVGAVFVKGPNTITVQPDGVSRLINYIHNNPVRAGVVTHPALSDWTSHRAYAGLAHRPAWLDIESGLARSGFENLGALTNWTQSMTVERAELEAFHVEAPPKPGRPRKIIAQPSAAAVGAREGVRRCRVSRLHPAYDLSKYCAAIQHRITCARACRASAPNTDRAIGRASRAPRGHS